jgi:hypothetical protein
VELFVDPKGDGRQWVEIELSPFNVIYDQLAVMTADAQPTPDLRLPPDVYNRDVWRDVTWNMDGLRTETRLMLDAGGHTTGWIADMAVPADPLLHRLGQATFHPMTLRANIMRYDWLATADPAKRTLLATNWAPVVWGCPHISPLAMGYLHLIARQ